MIDRNDIERYVSRFGGGDLGFFLGLFLVA